MDLIFDKVSFLPGEIVSGTAPASGTITVGKLGTPVFEGESLSAFSLGTFPEGAYTVVWNDGDQEPITSAFEVLSSPWTRLRYGFVAEFSDDVVVAEYVALARKLHLTAIQFYDWAWKHELLISDQLHYGDPLGHEVSTTKVKELITEYEKVGATSCGYVAVYAVDAEGWERWKVAGLFDSLGKPHQLGENFLWILDPANPEWLTHLVGQLKEAEDFGFKAFHLDQYGWPKMALTSDGVPVDLAQRFPEMLSHIERALPNSRHIFNNVNDFPTWSTSQTNQDATYIEVWDPHSTYNHLAELVHKAREYDKGKPIILSAYLPPFRSLVTTPDITRANAAFELAFASITSGGAAHLIAGGNGRVLHHPYYVTNYQATESTMNTLRKYFDFVVAVGDLIHDPSRVDITHTHSFGVNNEITFASDSPVDARAKAGHLWIRIFSGDTGLTIHVINLLDQVDTIWDRPKESITSTSKLTISVDSAGLSQTASVGYSSSGAGFELRTLRPNQNRFDLTINAVGVWTVVNIPYLPQR